MMSHRNLSSNALALHRIWGFRPDDRLLHALPIFHTHGLFVAINTTLLNGTAMIFLPRFDAGEVIRLLPRATVMMGVPTFYGRLLAAAGFDRALTRHMRLFISGSAPLSDETFDSFRTQTGHVILERYGMTETNMLTSNPLDGPRRGGSVGLPLPGVDVRIVDAAGESLPAGAVGDIEVRGPNVFRGYWRNPEKTRGEFRADGFFRTGDVGRFDADGYLSIVGRSKDLIISGGLNVYPKEVESVIDEMPGIGESAVVASSIRFRRGGGGGGDLPGGRHAGQRRGGDRPRPREARRFQGAQGGVRRRPAAAQRHGQGGKEQAPGAVSRHLPLKTHQRGEGDGDGRPQGGAALAERAAPAGIERLPHLAGRCRPRGVARATTIVSRGHRRGDPALPRAAVDRRRGLRHGHRREILDLYEAMGEAEKQGFRAALVAELGVDAGRSSAPPALRGRAGSRQPGGARPRGRAAPPGAVPAAQHRARRHRRAGADACRPAGSAEQDRELGFIENDLQHLLSSWFNRGFSSWRASTGTAPRRCSTS